jgi:hypothetical protein
MQRRLPAIFAPQPHESRSDRYVYVSTQDVMSALMNEGFVPVEARVSRSRDQDRQNYTKHMVRMRLLGETALAVGDTFLEVILRNAHDGTAAYELLAGLFKLLCLNGMAVANDTIASVHVRHAGNRDKQIQSVVDGAFEIIHNAPLALEAPKVWPTIELNRDEQMAFATAARTVRFSDKDGHVDTPITAEQLLYPRREADRATGPNGRSDLWRTFNVVQENTTKGGLSGFTINDSGRRRRMSTREIKSIDGDLKLNRELWRLASKMAELKAAA